MQVLVQRGGEGESDIAKQKVRFLGLGASEVPVVEVTNEVLTLRRNLDVRLLLLWNNSPNESLP